MFILVSVPGCCVPGLVEAILVVLAVVSGWSGTVLRWDGDIGPSETDILNWRKNERRDINY